MTTTRGTSWVAVVVWAISAALVLGAVGIGLRVPGLRVLHPLPEGSLLDYSRAPWGPFTPLTAAFVADVLGFSTAPGGPVGGGEPVEVVAAPVALAAVLADDAAGGGSVPASGPRQGGAPDVEPGVAPDGRPANDGFEQAAEVSQVPYSAGGDTGSATRQQGEPAGCAPFGGTVWYRYTAANDGALVAHTVGSDHPTALAVFEGGGLEDLEQLGCDSDPRGNARVAFLGEAAKTYHVQVNAPLVGGRLAFALEFVGSTTRASVSSAGAEGDHLSTDSFISADGRWLGFTSQATTLDPAWRQPTYFYQPNETQGVPAPAWWDTEATPYRCDDHAATGYSGDAVAANFGHRPCTPLAYVRDRLTHETVLVSVSTDGAQANRYQVWAPVLSADGRHVSFMSDATNLAEPRIASPWGPAGGTGVNVFVRDRDTDADGVFDEPGAVRTVRVSDSVDGEQQAETFDSSDHMSADGRYVAFYSIATNLVHDTNDAPDIFVRDRDADGDGVYDERGAVTTERVSVSDGEQEANGGSILNCMSRDGRYVAFRSTADNLVAGDTNGFMDTFVRDRVAGTTERTSLTWDGRQQNADSAISGGGTQWCLSDDARYHVFASSASNLVADDTNGMVDLFVRDRVVASTVRVSVAWDGTQATTGDSNPTNTDATGNQIGCYQQFADACDTSTATGHAMSRNGRLVAFSSPAVNLVPDDGNGAEDVFVRDLFANTTYRVSVSSAGDEGDLWSTAPRLSDDGRFLSFSSLASNLVAGDRNATVDVFVRELPGPWGASGWQ